MFWTLAACLVIPVLNGVACGNRSASVPELTDQSKGVSDEFTRDKPEKIQLVKEEYSRLLAERDTEIQRLEELLLQYEQALSNREQLLRQYEQSQSVYQQQWLQNQYVQRLGQGVSNHGVHVGPRGGQYTYTKSGKKRYLSSSSSSSTSSRKRSRRR
jgi:vacuolar-type H+-ATPase subunit I/STV1